MGVGSNIKQILKDKKISQKDFADMIEETTVNLNRYLNEQRNIPVSLYPLISKALNMSIDEIMGNQSLSSRLVPLIGKSSCGKPKDYDLSNYEPVSVPLDMYIDGMYAVEADGDSMAPRINDGDIVYCIPNQIIDNGKIVHYWLNGESGIKKYKINEAGTIISLLPLNPDYDIITIHCDDNYDLVMARVIGRIDKDF
ncbi:LexA family transcriptional regulator [Aliarcobacter lanthieri]|uniref:LexA family transcriptional regulator n=1 Tax=Aliarcobacter lanthieri TaxID=1355374 RepID=UPI00047916F6|nr:LexA family transcriptional regulator [Aliarcobacter lanthieri]